MGTSVGVGFSLDRNPHGAGEEASRKALAGLGTVKPDFVFVFATVGYNQEHLLRAVRETTGGAPMSGCSGEGIITRGIAAETNFAVCVMAVRSDELAFRNIRIDGISTGADKAGERLAEEVKPLLRPDTLGCFLFADGLVFNFSPFNVAFKKGLERQLPLFGGLAADNWTAKRTYQYHDGAVFSDGISCVLVSGEGGIASGISHGCVPIGVRHTITRSKGNIIYEIDGRPALDVLRDYVEDDWSDQWNKISLNLCLGFRTPDPIRKDYGDFIVRYMMAKDDREGYVTIQSDVRDGMEFWIVRRDKELIHDGLRAIARQIREKAGPGTPKFVMHFECMGRGKAVFREQEKNELIAALQAEFGEEVPWIGFYTYGEIGPVSGHNCIHNFTAVVAAVF